MAMWLLNVIFLLGLSHPSNAACGLQGNWYDSQSVPNSQLMFRVQQVSGTMSVFALTPNPQWGTGSVEYDVMSHDVIMHLDDGEIIKGKVASDCSNIEWVVPKATWIKVPHVDHVHVVFMNHLDVGYAHFIGDIINEYFQTFFPRAVRLAAEASIWRKNETFIYTTHPWLVSMYLDCPPNLIFNGIKIQCPTDEEIQVFDAAIRKGYIAWHAGPMNMQVEFMNAAVLDAGLAIADNLDKKYNRTTSVLSQRDVPGMTICALPKFRDHGIKAVTVGVNPGSAPPAVPKIFSWEDTVNAVIGIWHAGGYPLNPGSSLENAGGISIRDCTIAPNTSHALCFAFRTDNTGPPTSLEELDTYYEILREEFPDADVFASTLDQFIDNVNIDALHSVIGKEIGDTWIQGIASDPRKSAECRAVGLALSQCMDDNMCSLTDPVVSNATRFLVKLSEHTWGLPGIRDIANWTNADFMKARSDSSFVQNEQSWTEQRLFLNLTLEASQGHKLYNYITDNLNQLVPALPDLSDYMEIDATKQIKLWNGNVSIGFNSTVGTINHLTYNISKEDMFIYATSKRYLGEFSYHTYNETDFAFMASLYDYYGNAGYDKPNSTASASPETKVWSVKLLALYQSKSNPNTFLTHLTMDDPKSHSYYGAPTELWITINLKLDMYFETGLKKKLTRQLHEFSPPVLKLDFDLVWINKTATRLPEASMFSFYPNPPPTLPKWVGTLYKIGDCDGFNVGWVVTNGSQYQHAVDYVILFANDGKIEKDRPQIQQRYVNVLMNSTDVPLVCPITGDGRTPTPFPVPLQTLPDDIVTGIAYNLHNNIWNTNYPLYYPFLPGDENFKARFSLTFL